VLGVASIARRSSVWQQQFLTHPDIAPGPSQRPKLAESGPAAFGLLIKEADVQIGRRKMGQMRGSIRSIGHATISSSRWRIAFRARHEELYTYALRAQTRALDAIPP
jgi:hypothetical protein